MTDKMIADGCVAAFAERAAAWMANLRRRGDELKIPGCEAAFRAPVLALIPSKPQAPAYYRSH